ncbi:MAG: 50S ribosomal protein L17 [Alphaproteobacteria bacterium]|nr:50S ribosomal protein L17 [Alphaproteobacteria bacterium]OJV16362.1 MAG: 50S ribosomal protein L17 [Alphaproteobacteria bacterium 33-17]
MNHRKSGKKLNRTSAHRKALMSNLARAIVQHEQIITTVPKAKFVKPFVESLITLAKKGDLASRRRAIAILKSEDLAKKLFEVLASRYATRQGGYTRIIKAGFRFGDAAPRAVLEFVDRDVEARGSDIA